MRRRTFPNFVGDMVSLDERQERMERVMQMLGVTPEYPGTFNINDGARNRVMIGVIGSDYGIQIVDAAGNSVLLTNGTIVANAIKTGTLDCNLITVTHLSASVIVTGTLSATRISGGIFDCSLMTVQNLNAASITVGTFGSPNDRFTAGSISGVKISDGTITGDKLLVNTINADKIVSHSLTTNQLTINGVNASVLVNQSLTAAKIALATITDAQIYSLNADKITAGTIKVGHGGAIAAINIVRNGSNGYLTWDGGNKIWSDENQYMAFMSNGDKFYFYAGGTILMTLQRGLPTTFYSDGVDISNGGGLYVDGNFHLNGHLTDSMNVGGHNLDSVGTAGIDTINNTRLNGNNIYYWNLYHYSDRSLKKGIKNRKGGLLAIGGLNPIEFMYKEEKDGGKHIGFSAQEVEKILPELVHEDEDGIKSIKMVEMIPLLVGAIQELKKEIELLKEKKL